MNLTAILIVVVLWGSTLGGTGYWFYQAGKEHELATQAREDKAAAVATAAAASAVVAGVAKQRPRNTTIRQEAEREIRTETRYVDCRHSPEQLRRIDEALTGKPREPATADGAVPGASAPRR